jgi:hypothetical protein
MGRFENGGKAPRIEQESAETTESPLSRFRIWNRKVWSKLAKNFTRFFTGGEGLDLPGLGTTDWNRG